jgi:hypothetical protein
MSRSVDSSEVENLRNEGDGENIAIIRAILGSVDSSEVKTPFLRSVDSGRVGGGKTAFDSLVFGVHSKL